MAQTIALSSLSPAAVRPQAPPSPERAAANSSLFRESSKAALGAGSKPAFGILPDAAARPALKQLQMLLRQVDLLLRRLLERCQLIPPAAGGEGDCAPEPAPDPVPAPSPEPGGSVCTPLCKKTQPGGAGETLPFQEKLRQFLSPDANNSISEARLQYGIAAYQLYQKDPSLEQPFRDSYDKALLRGRGSQRAVREALRTVRDSGGIKPWEADWIYSLSYRAAQLEQDDGVLSSESSSALNFDQALTSAEVGLVYIQGGSVPVEGRRLD